MRNHSYCLLNTTSFLFIVLITGTIAGCSGSKKAYSETTYRAPGYVKKNYQQLIVYAKVEQDAYRQKLENAMVEVLGKHGFKAIPAYKNLDVSYKYDSVKFMSRINELKVDGVVAFDYLGQTTGVSDEYRYNGGMYNYFASGSAPFDLQTTAKQVGYVRLDFYNLDARVSQYNTALEIKLFNGLDPAIRQLTEDTYTRLKSDRIL
jgi:hypothetical protein